MSIIKVIINKYYEIKFGKLLQIYTHLTTEEKNVLYNLSKKLKAKNSIVVEIGSFLGSSSCFLAAGLTNGKVYCIDTWQNDAMSEGKRNTYQEFKDNTNKYSEKIVEIRGWSSDVVDTIKKINKSIDILFIDGDHSYEGVKKDWDLYFPMLTSGSIVVFHDSGWVEGVQKVINENVKSYTTKYREYPNLWWGQID